MRSGAHQTLALIGSKFIDRKENTENPCLCPLKSRNKQKCSFSTQQLIKKCLNLKDSDIHISLILLVSASKVAEKQVKLTQDQPSMISVVD